MPVRAALLMVVALVAGCGGSEEVISSYTATVEETTDLRETTESTTAPAFIVSYSSMDEEEDDSIDEPLKAVPDATPREVPPAREKAQSKPKAPEDKDAPTKATQPPAECRFFTQSEWVQASPEQKSFIQECDRAAGRTAKAPSPSLPPAALPQPQPKTSPKSGDVNCGSMTPAEALPYLLPGDPYGLDADNDGIPCE